MRNRHDRLGAYSHLQAEDREYDDVKRVLDLVPPDRPVTLEIGHIRLDGGTQPRAHLDPATIDEYAEEMRNGSQFPAVDVFYDGAHYWLADGFHRINAAVEADLVDFPATVHQGNRREAVLFSVGVNATHGLRRTNEDKRRAVTTLLQDDEWAQWSDREIARLCKVSHPFVARLRKDLSGNRYQIERTVRRGDTVYTMDTGGIREASQERGAPSPPSATAQNCAVAPEAPVVKPPIPATTGANHLGGEAERYAEAIRLSHELTESALEVIGGLHKLMAIQDDDLDVLEVLDETALDAVDETLWQLLETFDPSPDEAGERPIGAFVTVVSMRETLALLLGTWPEDGRRVVQ